VLVESTICTKFILIKLKPPNFIGICSTKFYMSCQYSIFVKFLQYCNINTLALIYILLKYTKLV